MFSRIICHPQLRSSLAFGRLPFRIPQPTQLELGQVNRRRPVCRTPTLSPSPCSQTFSSLGKASRLCHICCFFECPITYLSFASLNSSLAARITVQSHSLRSQNICLLPTPRSSSILPSMVRWRREYFQPRIICPKQATFLLLISAISSLSVCALLKTSTLVILAVHGNFRFRCNIHISNASRRFIMLVCIVHVSTLY